MQLLGELETLFVVGVLAVVALLWLRRIIHVGLLQEADEIPIGPDIVCPECGHPTPHHTYCGHCGTSLKALPKARPMAAGAVVVGDLAAPHEEVASLPSSAGSGATAGVAVGVAGATPPASAPGTASSPRAGRSGLGPRVLLTLFAVVMLGAVAIAAASAFVTSQGRDRPDCPDKTLPCSGAAITGPVLAIATVDRDPAQAHLPFADRTKYHDDTLGFGLEYDPAVWSVSTQDDGFLILSAGNGAVALIFEGGPVSSFDPQTLFDARRKLLEGKLLGYTADTDQARALLGTPILGYRPGIGGLFGGTVDSSQGPTTDLSVASVAATDGTITMVATLLAPVDIRDAALSVADSVVNSFSWPADEVAQ